MAGFTRIYPDKPGLWPDKFPAPPPAGAGCDPLLWCSKKNLVQVGLIWFVLVYFTLSDSNSGRWVRLPLSRFPFCLIRLFFIFYPHPTLILANVSLLSNENAIFLKIFFLKPAKTLQATH
jgi:hypothetical protein